MCPAVLSRGWVGAPDGLSGAVEGIPAGGLVQTAEFG